MAWWASCPASFAVSFAVLTRRPELAIKDRLMPNLGR